MGIKLTIKDLHLVGVARQREYGRRTIRKLKTSVFLLLGDACVKCGFNDARALQVDHVNGGGTAERKARGNYTIYRDVLRKNGDGYQLLCANCNWIKRFERRETKSRLL